MVKIKNIILSILSEQAPKTSKNNRLVAAIKNRLPVSFYYNGPRGEVLPGRRIKAEAVAMGLSKKGNLIIRAWVQPPSTSKKGFSNHGWRTFKVGSMSGIQIYEDETFDTKRPNYSEGDDRSMSVTYVTSDWGKQPEIQKPETEKQPEPLVQEPVQPIEPEVEKQPEELPQPKTKEKPAITPNVNVNRGVEVYDDLKKKVNFDNNQKLVSPEDFNNLTKNLYNKKLEDWKKAQTEIGGNTNPGEGTRRKIEKDSEAELFGLMKKDNIMVSNQQTPLQESLNRIKALIIY